MIKLKRTDATWTVTADYGKAFSKAEFTFYSAKEALRWIFENVSRETL